MNIPEPQLASPMPKGGINYADWVAEEKYDGHRILVRVHEGKVFAESRNGLVRDLPIQVEHPMSNMPNGVYDGELIVPGKRSYGVTELLNKEKLVFVIFDILEAPCGLSVCHFTYTERKLFLATAYEAIQGATWSVRLAETFPCISRDQLTALTAEMWSTNREGLILKKKASIYEPGKRSRDWIKIKALQSDVLTVTGFQAGKNGPYSTVILEDGSVFNENVGKTTVKTKNMKELDRISQNPKSFLGRKLRIEFQERTPDGSYRHPRWDRFEDE